MASSRSTAKKAVTTPPERRLYSRAEVAAMFGCGERLVKRYTLAGKLRATRPGGPKGPVFYRAEEIERFIADATE